LHRRDHARIRSRPPMVGFEEESGSWTEG
jgi:hypothetical protein